MAHALLIAMAIKYNEVVPKGHPGGTDAPFAVWGEKIGKDWFTGERYGQVDFLNLVFEALTQN